MINKSFRYAGETELERDAYLEKAAKWIYSIRMKKEIGGVNLGEILSELEKKELEDYVFSVMYPVIEKVGKALAKKFEIHEPLSVVDRLGMEVVKDFYKYNNEDFMQEDGKKYPFYVFVLGHKRGVIREEFMAELNIGRRVYDKFRKIERTRRYVAAKNNLDENYISSKTIAFWYEILFKEEMTREEVDRIINFVYPKKSLDQVEYKESAHDDLDALFNDKVVEDTFISAYNTLRPIEQFILLQQYGFCSDRYKDLSVRQLSCDSDFVRMAFLDKIAMCNLEYGSLEMQRPRINGFEKRNESLIVPATFYLKERFINNTRKKCKDILAREFIESNLSYNQCLHNLDDVCMQLWHELEDTYLIRKE